MIERLQKILSAAGVASRRKSEEFITGGRVTVNGKVVTELGSKADPETDRICLDGKPIKLDQPKRYIMLNKPAGYMTTMKDPDGRPIVSDLLKGVKERLYPVGRLDYNTEGLLLLTNDGEWANILMHPRHEIDKEYHVRVRGDVTAEHIASLTAGVNLDDGLTSPAKASIIRESENNTWISITIHEGRYRQVRRMCEAVGLTVVRLKRVGYGGILLERLKTGEYRDLTNAEVKLLGSADTKPSGRKPNPSHRNGAASEAGSKLLDNKRPNTLKRHLTRE